MVCVVKCEAICVVRDMSASGPPRSAFVTHVPGSTPVRELVDQVAKEFGYEANTVELVYSSNTVAHIVLNGSSEETLLGSGIKVDGESRNNFILQLKSTSNRASLKAKEMNGECELAMGASASPTGGATPKYHGPRVDQPPASQLLTGHEYTAALIKQDTVCLGYVGLVNQAMTCYLNSLLQALYMTPEFRNALYNWKYDPNTFKNKAYKCIPYQLQKLFLNLQTSQKTAVETTDLTKSFGWESSDAWQQHDIQELCRVMFDALEQVFKNTTQSDLIDRLYQGKMMDYVKCLECGKEKSREDTFLDIPLPVRPFGSTVAYGSVEEALRAFVQPETLDGANQYLCESCAKKCDAHKGLKFTKFPYLLTLHLKRFDFDYSTLHRIKLNDKVTFPMTLDLNSFVEQKKEKEEGSEEELAVSKNDNKDDSSTTDSGSALDDEGCHCQPVSEAATAGDSSQEDDEGIDVSSSNGTNHHENEKNRRHGLPKGPYLYDLFSIMIHSGSASGGHYYAYIKDFSNGEWFCFNDTSVTRITNDDIAKTYGGGSLRSYYSGAYSTSTNAYMLMYRQISEDNCGAMKVDELPEHIKELYKTLQENEQRTKEKANDIVKIKVYCQHPIKGVVDSKIYVYEDSTLQDATSQAYEAFKLSDAVPLSNCRLVSYNHAQESIEVSFDNRETEMFYDILTGLKHEDMLLEIKCTDEEFEEYKPGGLTLKVYVVDLDKEEVAAPVSLRVMLSSSIEELKKSISTISGITSQPENIVLVMHRHGLANDLIVLEDDLILLQNAGLYSSNKIYVSSGPVEKNFLGSKLHTVIDRFEHVLILHLALPDTDPDTLARLSIPSLSASQAITAKQSGDSPLTPTALDKVSADQALVGKVGGTGRSLTLPLILTGGGDEDGGGAGGGSGGAGGHSDQSASEDSSLTDSDRTLIGDVPDECLSDGDNQLASPPEDEPFSIPSTESPPVADEAYDEHWDDPSSQTQPKLYNYFKVCHTQKLKKMLKVQVDKRMLVETLKTCLEPYVGVPASCLKLVRVGDSESMRSRTCDSLASLKTEDALIVQLDRQLTADEHRVKVHLLQVNAAQPVKFLCDWIIGKGGLVGQTKKEIIDEMNKRNEMSLEYDKCRLRKKSWKNIGKVYLDNQTWVDDIMMYNNSDVFLQELDEPEQVMSSSQLCLLTRHWHPSTLALNPFCELVLDESTVADLKEKLSIKSNIPVEYVEFAKPSSLFPCDMSILSIHSELEWNHKNITTLDAWPLQINEDGAVIFYRDSREKLKQLSTDERSELTNKEAARLNTTGTVSTYSPRKERPLRIHLDLDRKSISQSDSTDAN